MWLYVAVIPVWSFRILVNSARLTAVHLLSPGSRCYGGRDAAGVVRWLPEDLGLDLYDCGGAVQPSQCHTSSGSSVLEQQQYPLSLSNHLKAFLKMSWTSAYLLIIEHVVDLPWQCSDQYLVSASSIGDKLVVSSLKSSPVPVMELGEGVSWGPCIFCLIKICLGYYVCLIVAFCFRKSKLVSVWTPRHSSWSAEDWITRLISGT